MTAELPSREAAEEHRGARELVIAALTVLAVAIAVAAAVFGLIVVLYDHGQHVAHAAVSARSLRP
jgi:hypothetical protein